MPNDIYCCADQLRREECNPCWPVGMAGGDKALVILKNHPDAFLIYPADDTIDNGVGEAWNVGHGMPDGVELLANPDFETDATNWTASGSATITRSTAQSYGGGASGKATIANVNEYVAPAAISLTVGEVYRVQAWVYSEGGTVSIQTYSSLALPLTTVTTAVVGSWVQLTTYGVAVSTITQIPMIIRQTTNSADFYIDDVSVEKLTTGRNLVQNPFFDTDTIWGKGAGWGIAGGKATHAAGSASSITQNSLVSTGIEYETVFKISGRTAGTVRTRVGDVFGTSRSADGIYRERLTNTSSAEYAGCFADASFDGSIEFVIVRPVSSYTNGRYASHNLVVNPYFDTSQWTGDNPDGWTVNEVGDATSNVTENPAGHCQNISDGTACYMSQAILAVGKTYVVTIHVSAAASGSISMQFGTNVVGTINSVGIHKVVTTCTGNSNFYITKGGAPTDVTIDYVRVEQILIEPSSNYPKAESLDTSGDGTADKDNYTAGNNATLTNPSTNLLRVARNGTNNPYARQNVLSAGLRYRVIAEARSDGNAVPRITDDVATLVTGTNSTDWQSFDFEFVSQGVGIYLYSNTTTGTEYTEWRNISIREVNPLNADLTAITINQPIGDTRGWEFNGLTSYADLLSAEFNAIFPRWSGARMCASQITTGGWTNGNTETMFRVWASTNDRQVVTKTNVNGRMDEVVVIGGGVAEENHLGQTSEDAQLVSVTWDVDDDEVRHYLNGILTETDSGVNAPGEDNISIAVLGASTIVPLLPYGGILGMLVFFDEPVPTADHLQTSTLIGAG